MSGWYKRDSQAALDGMRSLTLEERGAYTTILDLIYLRDGSVPDDPMFISGWLGVFPKTWNRIRKVLIDAGKLVPDSGVLTNRRATKEVLLRKARTVENKTNGRLGGIASSKINDIAEASARQTKTENQEEEKIVNLDRATRSSDTEQNQGFTNSDGTVSFTSAELIRIGIDLPHLVDPLGQITHLAESTWMDRLIPQNRKRAIVAKLRKDNSKLAAKVPRQTSEQKQISQFDRDDEYQARQKSLAVRRRLLGT